MENSIPKGIVKNNGDLPGEQLGKVVKQPESLIKTKREARRALLRAQSTVGLKKLCTCAGMHPLKTIRA